MQTKWIVSLIHKQRAVQTQRFVWLDIHYFIFFVLIWIGTLAIGCEQPIQILKHTANAKPQQLTAVVKEKGPGETLPNELNSAKAAALYVSSLPAVDNMWIRREISLQAALYKASYERRLGDAVNGFLLDRPVNAGIQSLAIDLDEFRLRVLAELSELGPPVEWAMQDYRSWGAIHGTFEESRNVSGKGRKLPTHLSFRINERIDEQATVLAQITSSTPGGRSVRQQVSCTYNGVQWIVNLTGLRTVW